MQGLFAPQSLKQDASPSLPGDGLTRQEINSLVGLYCVKIVNVQVLQKPLFFCFLVPFEHLSQDCDLLREGLAPVRQPGDYR